MTKTPPTPIKIVVEVWGGVVQAVYASAPVYVRIVDWDNIKAGGPKPDRATARLMIREKTVF